MALFRQAAYAIAVSLAATMSAAAADWPLEPATYPATYPLFSPRPIAQWESEIGGRYWYSSGRTQLDLFGATQANGLISRLTYSDLQAHSGEVFGRAEHLSGFFIKGFVGGGAITGGGLRDEDFVTPSFPLYSSTNSEQRDGRLAYATVDLGWTWRSEDIKLGFFAGYHYYFERVNAFGCVQTASPVICVPPVPASELLITQETNWNAVRLGFNGEWRWGGWILNADLAWIPYAWLNANDTHWQRIPFDFSGPTPELGNSFNNVQIEALLRYQFQNGFSVGIGGRYWRIDTSSAQAHFESSAVGGGVPQTISLVTERWGGFLQASYKFGELRPTRY